MQINSNNRDFDGALLDEWKHYSNFVDLHCMQPAVLYPCRYSVFPRASIRSGASMNNDEAQHDDQALRADARLNAARSRYSMATKTNPRCR